MGDIEDAGLHVGRNGKSDGYFNVKLRSKMRNKKRAEISLETNREKEEEAVGEAFAGLSGDFCGGGPADGGGGGGVADCGCGGENCCKNGAKSCSDGACDDSPTSNADHHQPSSASAKRESGGPTVAAADAATDSNLPWRNAVYLRTWGCSHNNSDSEYMAGLLTRAGYTVTANRAEAALWLLNSCTVKTPSEMQLSNQVRDALAQGKRVVVGGCVSQAAPSEPWLKGVSIIGVQQIDRVVEVVDETLNGNVVRLISARRQAPADGSGDRMLPLDLPKVRRNEFVEILAINSGCLNHCTYCKTKQARGDLRSFALDALVERARSALVDERCRELWLTSEDLGAWGRDLGMVLPDLLRALVRVIPDGCMMRLGMTNPPYILDYLEEVAEILRHPRVYAFLHIPVQAGSDAVLGEMRREYTREHFCRIVDYMLENVPGIYIATDFICAFPTETKADFEESMELVRRYKFPSLFINQYYPRPGTPAARLKKIENGEARRRTSEMSKLFRSYTRYTRERIGGVEKVLICEMATDGVHYVGHNKNYEHILVVPPTTDGRKTLLGTCAVVRVTDVSKFYMKALLVDCEEASKSPLKPTSSSSSSLLNGAKLALENSLKNAGLATKIVVGSQALLLLYFVVKLLITAFLW